MFFKFVKNKTNMIKYIFISVFAIITSTNVTIAQTEKQSDAPNIQKKEMIILGGDGEKMEMKVEINGNKITINGKEVEDSDNGKIKIDRQKKIIILNNKDISDENLTSSDNKNIEETIDSMAVLGVMTETNEAGAKIENVVKESAAEKAGLEVGDIITAIDNKKIDGHQSLAETIKSHKPFDLVKISYLRNGKKKLTNCTLQLKKRVERKIIITKKGTKKDEINELFQMPEITSETIDLSGLAEGLNGLSESLKLDDLSYKLFPSKQKLGIKIQDIEEENGVKVIDVSKDGLGEKSGLLKDDIISEIAGEKIKNTDDARYQLREVAEKKAYNVKVMRNGKEMMIEIKNPKELKTVDL
jgi:serine protease Do